MSNKKKKVDYARKFTITEIYKTTFKTIKKTILPTFLWFLIFIIIAVIVKFLLLNVTNATWNINQMREEYQQIIDLKVNPEYVMSATEQQIYRLYQIYNVIIMIANFMLIFIPLYGTQLVLSRKIFILVSDEEFEDESWNHSIKFPFSSKQRIFFSLLIIIIGSSLTVVGLIIFIFPAFLLLIFIMFLINVYIVDETDMKGSLKGTRYYLHGALWKSFFFFSMNIMIMLVLSLMIQAPVMNAMGLTNEKYLTWLDPSDFHFFSVILYDFMALFLQVICFIMIPTLVTVSFAHRREMLIKKREVREKEAISFSKPKIIRKTISLNKKYYFCGNCKAEIPISSKKCSKCGQLHYVKFEK